MGEGMDGLAYALHVIARHRDSVTIQPDRAQRLTVVEHAGQQRPEAQARP